LTRRANQGHIDIIADIVEPAPENRQRAFQWRRRYPQRQFQVIEPVSSHFPQFVNGSKRSLTRRANQGHINIIAKTRPGRRNPPWAFLLKYPNRTAAARHDASSSSLSPERRQRAAVRAPTTLAGTRERGGPLSPRTTSINRNQSGQIDLVLFLFQRLYATS
jgi:hypothetical protein